MDIPETNEYRLRQAANGLAGLKALRDLQVEDAEAINYAYQQLLAAADQLAGRGVSRESVHPLPTAGPA